MDIISSPLILHNYSVVVNVTKTTKKLNSFLSEQNKYASH